MSITRRDNSKERSEVASPARAVFLREVKVGSRGFPADVRIAGGRVVDIVPAGRPEPGDEVVECRGRTLLPGLVDAHVHAAQHASTRRRLDVSGSVSAVAAADLVAEHLRRTVAPTSEVVLGYGFRDAVWPDRPAKSILDRVAPDRPVLLVSKDLHTAWLNSKALALLGRDHPTGVLQEGECLEATAALGTPSTDVFDRWVVEAMHAAAARGVTGILDFEYADNVSDWSRRLGGNEIPVRVACSVHRPMLEDAIGRGLRTGEKVPGSGGLLEVGPFKIWLDGSLNTRTAFCYSAYSSHNSCDGPPSHGRLELEPQQLEDLMRTAATHGLLPAVHAIGDHANSIAIGAFENVGCAGRIEHAQLVHPDDLHRFARPGLVVGVQPAHAPDDRDVADEYWRGSPSRAFANNTLLRAGATLELGSDAPVAALDPWDGIAAAVTRTDDDRPPWHPEESLPVDVALRAASGGRDTVVVGDVADLVLTDANPADVDAWDLRRMPVFGTMLAGRWTFRGPGNDG